MQLEGWMQRTPGARQGSCPMSHAAIAVLC